MSDSDGERVGVDEVIVDGYADLVADGTLRGLEPDIVARELQARDASADGDGNGIVAVLPDWLRDEKELEPVGRSTRIVSGRVDHETPKAYLVVDGATEAWLPKSVIRVYRAATDATLEIPQQGLLEFDEADTRHETATGGADE
jgi:hypothetical protein